MKLYQDSNVYEAALERLEFIFNHFENILIAFSGGKDSGVLLNLAYEYAKSNNMLHKMAMYYQDYEGGYTATGDYVKREFDRKNDIKRYWLCLPYSAACSCSMHQTSWIPWNIDEEAMWCRNMPAENYVINQSNCWFPFQKGTSGFDTRIIFAKEFAKVNGKTAVLIGLRADESLTRLSIITSNSRCKMFNETRYSKIVNENVVNFYPLYDWCNSDIWTANYRFAWDYNKLYDLFYRAGVPFDNMRTSSPFHHSGQAALNLYRIIEPNMWSKLLARVNGVNFAGIYGNTKLFANRKIKKPDHFTWKQYSEFLLSTLPEAIRNKFISRLQTYLDNWKKGKGRNLEVIKYMKDLGMDIEVLDEIVKNCKKPKIYKKTIIKGDILDNNSKLDFRHIPNYKDICIAILKNDFNGIYLSFSRTKEQETKKREALRKYKGL